MNKAVLVLACILANTPAMAGQLLIKNMSPNTITMVKVLNPYTMEYGSNMLINEAIKPNTAKTLITDDPIKGTNCSQMIQIWTLEGTVGTEINICNGQLVIW